MGRLKTIGDTSDEEDGIATTAKEVLSVDFKKCNFPSKMFGIEWALKLEKSSESWNKVGETCAQGN